MEREELIKLIMRRIYTRRIYAEGLADDILHFFSVVGRGEQLVDFLLQLPDSDEIRMKARELDEKDFGQWWWETVYKGNVL